MKNFFNWLQVMALVIVLFILILICEITVCYWFSLIHWTVGLFVACILSVIDIYVWNNPEY